MMLRTFSTQILKQRLQQQLQSSKLKIQSVKHQVNNERKVERKEDTSIDVWTKEEDKVTV
jgi:hypothetical protein